MPARDTRPDGRRPDRHRRRASRIGAALAVAGFLASLLALAPATPAQATTRPILMVGGFSQTEEFTEPTWADPLAAMVGLPADQVRVVELSGWPIPGSSSMEESADEILAAIDELYDDYGRIDIIAISQGSPAARRTLQKHPASQAKVAGFISLSGANIGIARDHPNPDWAPLLDACTTPPIVWTVCEQMVWDDQPGNTPWLEALNGVNPAGDPTPGDGEPHYIDYYYIYSERTPTTPPEDEGLLAYDWTEPLPDADEMSAQDACPTNPNRFAPHAGLYSFMDPDAVMTELVIDALNRAPLAIDDPATCEDHPGYPSG